MRTLASLCFILVFTLQGTAFAAENTGAAKLLHLMGFDVSIEQLSLQMQTAPDVDRGFPEQVKRDWAQVAQKAFQPDRIMQAATVYLDDKLSAKELAAAETYFTGPLGRKVTALENESQQAGNSDKIAKLGPKLLYDLAQDNPERLRQIEDMIEALGAVEAGTSVAMNIAFAMNSAIISSSENPNAITDDQLLSAISSRHDAIADRMRQTLLYDTAYIYRDISNAELDDYIGFLKGDLGRKIYSNMNLVFEQELTRAATEFGRELMRRARTRQL